MSLDDWRPHGWTSNNKDINDKLLKCINILALWVFWKSEMRSWKFLKSEMRF